MSLTLTDNKCAMPTPAENLSPKNYVLVHGAWGGRWEFADVQAQLSADGSLVQAVDLPGHGDNKKEIAEVTMAAYVSHMIEVVNQIEGKVVLVGHSIAGAIISQVAESIPEKVDRLVYVCAMLPKSGDTPLALMESDELGELLARLTYSEDQSYVTLTENEVKELLLNDVTDEARLAELVPDFLIKQAVEPFTAVAHLTAANMGSVPKYYIRATQDKVLSLTLQDRMIRNWNVEKVFTLDSGHFPLTSMASNLSAVVQEAAALEPQLVAVSKD